jgi:glycosyltransferase involved in cell wall biosynthesis
VTVPETLSHHPIIFETPVWRVDSPWNAHFALGLLLVDLLRPRQIVQLGLGDGALYHTLCQAVRWLDLPARGFVIEPTERPLDRDAAAEHAARCAGFSSLLTSGYVETAETFAPGSVDLLVWNDAGTFAEAEAAFAAWLPRLSARGVVLYHPIFPTEHGANGWQYWHRLRAAAPSIERLSGAGLGILQVGALERERLDWLRDSTSPEGLFLHRLLSRLNGTTAAAPPPAGSAAASSSASPAATAPAVMDGAGLRAINYCLKPGYIAREQPAADDPGSVPDDVVNQPDVYAAAARLARSYGCTQIIDLSAGKGKPISLYLSEFQVIGVAAPEQVERSRATLDIGWIAWDFDQPEILRFPPEVLRQSVILCADGIEHLVHPEYLLATLREMLEYAPAAVISTPDRNRARGYADFGPPADPHHVREWNLTEFERLLRAAGLRPEFTGHTRASTRHGRSNILSVLLNPHAPPIERAPDDFRVTAIVSAYNEGDILGRCLQYLIDQGVSVYVIDNWSTDDSLTIARAFLGRGVIGIEQFPAGGRALFELAPLLQRIDTLASSLKTDWVMHHDVDELFESPWPGYRIKDAIYWAHRGGWSVVNHALLEFRVIDQGFIPGSDHRAYFKHFELGSHPAYRNLQRAWKAEMKVDRVNSGGHTVTHDPRLIAPFHGLIRHYTHRSEAHGQAKIKDRLRRTQAEMNRNWGSHHRAYAQLPALTRDPLTLTVFDESFYTEYLAERLFSTHLVEPAPIGGTLTPSGG